MDRVIQGVADPRFETYPGAVAGTLPKHLPACWITPDSRDHQASERWRFDFSRAVLLFQHPGCSPLRLPVVQQARIRTPELERYPG